jgi:CRP/FNR family transcriptional regulator
MNIDITTSLLRQYPVLNVLSEEECLDIIPLIKVQKIEKDESLYCEGETSNKLFFVVEGWFKAEKISSDGRQQTLRFIGPGEIINELAVFAKVPNAVSVIAMEESLIFYLWQNDLATCMGKYPKLSNAVIERMGNRIQHLLEQIENLSLHTVEERLARFLLAESQDNIWERQMWVTQAEIAARLGTVLDVVNRNLQKLVKEGVIEIHRDKIKIINREQLEFIAGG